MAEQKKSTTSSKNATTTASKPKAAAPKATAAKKSTGQDPAPKAAKPRTKKASAASVNEEMRQTMIREAAYYRALNRGFGGSAELEDWCAAEREIDAMLGKLTK